MQHLTMVELPARETHQNQQLFIYPIPSLICPYMRWMKGDENGCKKTQAEKTNLVGLLFLLFESGFPVNLQEK